MPKLYYLQDSREYIGNCVSWWAKDGAGYTTDLSKAETYTKESAQTQHYARNTDIPWPKSYIDKKINSTVDIQRLSFIDAMIGDNHSITRVEVKPKKVKKPHYRCSDCGKFRATRRLSYYCEHCNSKESPIPY